MSGRPNDIMITGNEEPIARCTGSLSRRKLLQGGMAGITGMALARGAGRNAAAAQDEPGIIGGEPTTRDRAQVPPLSVDAEPYIDAHSHVWTPDLDRYPLGEGYARADMQPASFTGEELLSVCRPLGVGRVNLIQMSYYGFDNSYMLDMIAAYPDRFVGTAIIDPEGADPGAEMARLAPLGVRAFRVQPQFLPLPMDRWLDHPGYDSMFKRASESGQVISFLIDPDALPEVDRMCRKYPNAAVIVDHLARIGVDGQFREPAIDALCALAQNKNAYVKVGAFYALSPAGPPYLDLSPLIHRVIESYGADRCMWESDCPFQVVDHTYADSINLIRERLDFLGDADRAWLLTRTAESLLFNPAN